MDYIGSGIGFIAQELEKILPKEPDIKYPICLAGERACPPEDCGESPGYEELLKVIQDPQHEEYDSMMEWLGGGFDPAAFSPSKVMFDDPQNRLKNVK